MPAKELITAAAVLIFAVLSCIITCRHIEKRYGSGHIVIPCTAALSLLVAFIYLVSKQRYDPTAIIRSVPFFLLLLSASAQDIKERECDDSIHVMILLASFIGTAAQNVPGRIASGCLIFLIMLIPALFTKCPVGGADIKFSAACGAYLGLSGGLAGLFLGTVISVAVNLIRNRGRNGPFPMIPYLSAGFLILHIIEMI